MGKKSLVVAVERRSFGFKNVNGVYLFQISTVVKHFVFHIIRCFEGKFVPLQPNSP